MPILSNKEILSRANIAARNNNLVNVYRHLRMLPFADYCRLHLAPMMAYPNLAKVLPIMPPNEVQKKWVGDSGSNLMLRSSNLVRLFDLIAYRVLESGLAGKTILDYGCGWGRLLRLMNYHSPVDKVIGIDPMQSSLDHCKESQIPNPLKLVSTRPKNIKSVDTEIDFAFAFSVFTHTPHDVTRCVLRALRPLMSSNSVFVPTIRTDEWLVLREGAWPDTVIEEMKDSFKATGYGFRTYENSDSLAALDYGDTIMSVEYFSEMADEEGWSIKLIDRDFSEPFQIAVALSPK